VLFLFIENYFAFAYLGNASDYGDDVSLSRLFAIAACFRIIFKYVYWQMRTGNAKILDSKHNGPEVKANDIRLFR